MLRVRTYLDRSIIHGIGLFADEDIPEGRVVWEFSAQVDLVFGKAEWERLLEYCAPESMEQIRKYSYKEGQRYYVCFDNAQFMNHDPARANVISGDTLDSMVAARAIRTGEELLCDYFEYSDPDDYNLCQIRRPGQG